MAGFSLAGCKLQQRLMLELKFAVQYSWMFAAAELLIPSLRWPVEVRGQRKATIRREPKQVWAKLFGVGEKMELWLQKSTLKSLDCSPLAVAGLSSLILREAIPLAFGRPASAAAAAAAVASTYVARSTNQMTGRHCCCARRRRRRRRKYRKRGIHSSGRVLFLQSRTETHSNSCKIANNPRAVPPIDWMFVRSFVCSLGSAWSWAEFSLSSPHQNRLPATPSLWASCRNRKHEIETANSRPSAGWCLLVHQSAGRSVGPSVVSAVTSCECSLAGRSVGRWVGRRVPLLRRTWHYRPQRQ